MNNFHTLAVAMDEFLRTFAIQEKARLMFLLGAGASAASGIPTAAEMIWMFKREIYSSRTGTSPEAFRDLTLERHRRRLQSYFDSLGKFPSLWADDEYSTYFETCYPKPDQRAAFIRKYIRDGRPSIGYECLSVLLAQRHCDWVWTTNFDDLVERAERADAWRRMSHIGPESARRLDNLLQQGLSPVLVKLHGDYRYDALQNTSSELLELDEHLRRYLEEKTTDQGLIVVGYSGRDESVMSALEKAVANGNLCHGIYWCVRSGAPPGARVKRLIDAAAKSSGNGGFVEIQSFDDLLFRLYRQCSLTDKEIDGKAEALFQRRAAFNLTASTNKTGPVKTNGIKVIEYPTTPFSFKASISGWKELRTILDGQEVVAGLFGGKVYAFGYGERIHSLFQDRIEGTIEPGSIHGDQLRHSDSVMLGLLYDVIATSLVKDYGLVRAGNREHRLFYIPVTLPLNASHQFSFRHLKHDYALPVATRKGTEILNEAFSFQLDYHEENLWFVLLPRVVITGNGRDLAPIEKRRLANAELSSRFNKASHERLLFWFSYLTKTADPITFAFPSKTHPACRIVLDTNYAFSYQKGL